jgi:AAA+ ATPase superfamily predicted ATPase
MTPHKAIIGRTAELTTLKRLYESDKSEFAMVYGRRRVGKTFLIAKTVESQFTFRMTALSKGSTKAQLQNFHNYLSLFDASETTTPIPKNWLEAFQILIQFLSRQKVKRKVIFFDELPWFDSHNSDFLIGLEHFWNGWAAYRTDILLITCGSAASWMIKKLIRDKGGLHNRVTERILIQPFTLQETEKFLQAKGGDFDRYQLLELYMAVGGIPFYLESIQINRSVAQNIDRLFFTPDGLLHGEYFDLYRSLFKNHTKHIAIVEALASKSKGLSRKELVQKSGLKEGGGLSLILNELTQSGFIKKHFPFGRTHRDALYQLSDAYTLFYLTFVKSSKSQGQGTWLSQLHSPKWRAWSGYAFEQICHYHTPFLKNHLGIRNVYTEVSTWRSKKSSGGAQIDLIFDRQDRVINICEIKFSETPYTITKAYASNLQNKLAVFKEETQTRKTLFLTMISTYGIKPNIYAQQYVKDSLTMDALFD